MTVMSQRFFALPSRFRRSADGVAAVEFGLLVPLLFIMFIGTVEIGQAVGLDRRVSMATASTADLIAREQEVDNTKLAGIMEIVKHLLSPYDADRLQVSVFAVRADTVTPANVSVQWSYSHNGASVPGRCQAYAMPAGLLSGGAWAVIVEGRYDYEPLLVSQFLNSSVVLSDKATVSPRNACTRLTGRQCTDACS